MPALPSVPNVFRVRLTFSDAADTDVTNTLYFQYTGGPPSAADTSAFASTIFGAAADFYPLMGTDVTHTGVTVTDLSSASAPEAVATGSDPGTRSGGPLSGGTCAVVSATIARRYRGGKPRSYFPFGVDTDLSTRQTWSTVFVAALQSAYGSFTSSIIGTNHGSTTISNHVNVSYYEGTKVVISPTTGRARNVPQLRTTPVVDTIVNHNVVAYPGSQRRRNR